MSGKCVILSAPSGSGKTTLVRFLLNKISSFQFSVSACSRLPREGEVDGKDYHFLTPDEFRKRIDQGDFLEWEEVYAGRYYGTLKSEVERIWNAGGNVAFDVDVKGGSTLKKVLKEKALSIFIKAPSIEAIEQRLRDRASDSQESIEERVVKAKAELEFEAEFDTTIINDDLKNAQDQLLKVVQEFLKA